MTKWIVSFLVLMVYCLAGSSSSYAARTGPVEYQLLPNCPAGVVNYTQSSGAINCQALGNGLSISNGTMNTTIASRKASSPTVGDGDMGGQIIITSGGLTIPAISSTIFPASSSLSVVNMGTSTASVTSNPTVNTGGGCSTSIGIPAGYTWQIYPDSDGVSLDCFQTASGSATPLPSPGSGATLTAPRSYYVCTTTCTVTLPTPAAGYEFCIMNDDNVSTVITLAAISGVQFETTARTSYKASNTSIASSGAVGDKICYVGRDSTHYLAASFVGTWN